MSAEAESPDKEYHFRPHYPADLNFVQSSWGHSYYKGYSYQLLMSPKEFHYYHRPIREKILSRGGIAIVICAATSDPEIILGWVLVETQASNHPVRIVHYLYVKEAFKGLGIASELISRTTPSNGNVLYSHTTERAERILKNEKYNKRFCYAPHLI